jgi:hypothetical protein
MKRREPRRQQGVLRDDGQLTRADLAQDLAAELFSTAAGAQLAQARLDGDFLY